MLKQVLNEGRFSRYRDSTATTQPLFQRLVQLRATATAINGSLEDAVQAVGAMPLSARDANILYFCDRLCEECDLHSDMDAELFSRFHALRPLFAAFLLTHEDALYSLRHPLFTLLDQLWQLARYWCPELGKSGEKYRTRLEAMLEQLSEADAATAPFADWCDSFASQTLKDSQRADLLANRICDTERSAMAGKHAAYVVRRQVNTLLSRTEMPDIVAELIREPFRHSLQMIYLAHGAGSEKWDVAIHAIHCLQDSVLQPKDESEKQRHYQLIPMLPDMLRSALVAIGDPQVLEDWLGKIEALHMQILIGNSVPLQAAELLSVLPEEAGISATVSEVLLEQAAVIPVGGWVIVARQHGESLRCRLVLKQDDAGRLLFVNVLGAKCLDMSFEEFAYLLSVRQVRLLEEDNNFTQRLHDVASELIQLYEKQLLLRQDAHEQRARETARRQHAEAKARQEAETLARERAAAEAVMAAQVRAVEAESQAIAAQEAAAQETLDAEQAQLRLREDALQLTHSLGVGAWVEMEVEGVWQKCKLAAVINSTGKLIFTNREGRKVFEPKRDDLMELLLKKRMVVIETGSQFESSLQKVIQSLRND